MQNKSSRLVESPTYVSILILVLALAVFLRFYRLASAPPGLYHDEAINGDNCLRNIEDHRLELFYPENGGREGLYIAVATLSVYCFGNTSWALRFPAAIFGVLTVLGVYLVAAELFSRPVGLLASFFIATSFWHILFSRLALRAIAGPVFLTLGLYLLLTGLRRAIEGRAYIGTMLSAGLAYGLGFHTYIAYRATPVLVGVVLFHGFQRLRQQGQAAAFGRAFAVFCASAALVTAPLAIYFLSHPHEFVGRLSQLSVANSVHPVREVVFNTWRTARMFFVRGDSNWRHNYAYRAELYWPVAALFAVGVVIAFLGLCRKRAGSRFAHGLVLAWMAVAAAPAVLSDDSLPHALRSLLLVPPTFILTAIGAGWLLRFFDDKLPKAALAVAVAASALMLVYEPFHTYFDAWTSREEVARAMEVDAVAVAQKINALPRRVPKYVAIRGAEGSPDGLPASTWTIQYLTRSYTTRQREETNIHYVSPSEFRVPAREFCQAVTASLPPGSAVFCLESHNGV